MTNKNLVLFFVFNLLLSGVLSAQNLVQWRGANRDGQYTGQGLLEKWPDAGPSMLWSVDDIGVGFASPTVSSDRIFITGQQNGIGYIFAFELKGKQVYKMEYGPEWNESFPGVRSNITLNNNKLYFTSAYGVAICADAPTGKIIWKVDLQKEFGAQMIRWGIVEAPVVFNNNVYFTPGGTSAVFVALNPETGALLWKTTSESEKSAYCSPLLFNHKGVNYIVTSCETKIMAFNADNGKIAWTYPQTNKYGIHPNTPLYHNGYLYSVTGYGIGGIMLKISDDGNSVTNVWSNSTMDNQIGGVVLINNLLISSGHENDRAWQALDFATGEVKFKSDLVGKGTIVANGNFAYVYSEKGEVALYKVTNTAFELAGKFKVTLGSEQHWAHLVIDNGVLYVRHGNALMAYSIKL